MRQLAWQVVNETNELKFKPFPRKATPLKKKIIIITINHTTGWRHIMTNRLCATQCITHMVSQTRIHCTPFRVNAQHLNEPTGGAVKPKGHNHMLFPAASLTKWLSCRTCNTTRRSPAVQREACTRAYTHTHTHTHNARGGWGVRGLNKQAHLVIVIYMPTWLTSKTINRAVLPDNCSHDSSVF